MANLSTFLSKKLGVVVALATMISQVVESGPEVAVVKIAAYALLGVGYVLSQAVVDSRAPRAVPTMELKTSETDGGE